jgi:hypothetical protein
MREAKRCERYERCENAKVCLRCLVPAKHSTDETPPFCFKEAKGDRGWT